MIGILDCDIGNLRSVVNAVYSLGYDVNVVRESAEFDELTHLILPGVGSYRMASDRLHERGLVEGVRRFAESGRPLLGICLGMQLLSTTGEEGGTVNPGLDLVPGSVARLDAARVAAIPHVGWNGVEFGRRHPVLDKVKTGVDFYFVHSYYLDADDRGDVVGECDCGQRFAAVVARRNIVGFQFHPEKSQANGLRLLDNFCSWDGAC